MLARLSTLFSLTTTALILLSASPSMSEGFEASNEAGLSPRSEAAIDKAAGNYSRCLLKASAQLALKGNEAELTMKQGKCQDTFNASVDQATASYRANERTFLTAQVAKHSFHYAEGLPLQSGRVNDSTVQMPCQYPAVGDAVFSGTQRQILFGAGPPYPVPQTYTFGKQYGDLVRANISAPSLKTSSFTVICGYSPKSAPTALPLLVCVEKNFQGTRYAYVTHWTRDCVATNIDVIGYEPGRFIGRIRLTRIRKQ